MKIAIINSVYKSGSTGRISFEMSRYFMHKGHEAKVFFGRGDSKDSDSTKISTALSVVFHTLTARIFDSSGLFGSFLSTKRLLRFLKKYNPDVIIANNLHGYYLNLPLFLKYVSKSNIKIIFVLHDCWLFTGHCAYFDLANCFKWRSECFGCPNKKCYPKSLVFDNSRKNYLLKKDLFSEFDINNVTIVTPSEWLLNNVRLSFLGRFQSCVINNGVDVSRFSCLGKNISNTSNTKTILLVANIWVLSKGLNDVIKLAYFFKDLNIKIVMIGKIKDKVNLPNNIIHINRTDNLERLVEYYKTSDVFFNPTYEDNYPTVNLEALACRLPVVSYNSGGACEAIDQRFSVSTGDISEACKKIKYLLDNPSDYLFPDNARLSKDVMYSKYLKLLEGMNNNEKIS